MCRGRARTGSDWQQGIPRAYRPAPWVFDISHVSTGTFGVLRPAPGSEFSTGFRARGAAEASDAEIGQISFSRVAR